MRGRIKLWQLSRPVAGVVVTHGLPGAVIIALLGLLVRPAGASAGLDWSLGLGWLAGSLVVGLLRRDRPSPLSDDLPEHVQLQVMQAVHDDPVVEDVDVARGVVGYLRRERRTTRRGPRWRWVLAWALLSGAMVLFIDGSMAEAPRPRVAITQAGVVGLITAAVAGEWRLRTRAQSAGAAARKVLAAAGERGGDTA